MKIFNRITAVILVMLLMCSISFTTYAVEEVDYKNLPTDSKMVSSEFASKNETHYYTFIIDETMEFDLYVYHESNPKVDVTGLLYMEGISYPLVKINEIVNNKKPDEYYPLTILEAGKYYLSLTAEKPCLYDICAEFKKVRNNDTEPNNSNATAQKIDKDETVLGAITLTDRIDVYEFTLNKRQEIQIYRFDLNKNNYYIIPADKKAHSDDYLRNSVYFDEFTADIYDDYGWWDGYDIYVLDAGTYNLVVHNSGIYSGWKYKLKYETDDAPATFLKYGTYCEEKISLRSDQKADLSVIDGKVEKWSVSDSKIIKIKKLSQNKV